MSVRLFVGNLSYDVTEADLRGLFGEVANVSLVRLPVDRETGRPRGFAFVDVAERPEAEAVISRFNQQSFKGRMLAISEAVARDDASRGPPQRSFGGGPGGGGGGPGMRNDGVSQGGGAPAVRTFGPDALPKNKRRPDARNNDKGPRGPIKELGASRSRTATEDDADGVDEVPFWAVDDGKSTDDE